MSLTWIDVNDDLLAEVMHLMGATDPAEAINTAVREYVAGRLASVEE